MTQGSPDPQAGDGGRVTPIGTRRTSVADLQQEIERLTAALQQAEQRRREAERTLFDVARLAAADAADLRARLAEAQAGLTAAPEAPADPGPQETAEVTAAAATPPVTPRRGGRARRIRRVVLAAGLTAGLLACVDGVLTIFWQEPLTALMQSRSQSSLRSDLGRLQQTFAAAPRLQRESDARRMVRQATTLLEHPRPAGSALGSIDIPRIGLKTVFVEATDHDALTKGPGHYKGTVLPGMTGTVGLAGHRTTYGAPFRHVDNLPPGTRIDIRMPYGRFVYRVTGTQITTPDDAASLRSQAGLHRLVLTACHPLYSAAKRIVVTARQVYAAPA
ncbi:class E sortase [Baekduia soli]|uniref:Class E sortase n=1 Tax=Baekduia soli TaxID=496014 RepID=A0A5B8U1K4_9ACTN|nr:class E sortase [Baekduia soli]QEC46909.1 class E sortase [Baekduia soli]